MIKNYLKSYAYLFGIIIISTIFLSIINYFIKLPTTTIKIIIPIIAIFISSIILGKNSKEKAYLEGLKFGGIYLIFTTIIKLLIKNNFNYKTIIIYISMILSSIIGSMIGINLKK